MKASYRSVLMVVMSGLFLSGCGMHLTRSYPLSPIHPEERATLTFTTDTLGKSYGYIGLIRRLRLSVYEMQPGDKPGQVKPKEYLGTIWITKENNSTTIPIPSGGTLGLQAHYYEILLNMQTHCMPQCLLIPKQGGSYTLKYTQDNGKCWVSLTESEGGEPLVTGSASTLSEERKQGQKRVENPPDEALGIDGKEAEHGILQPRE